MKSLVTPIAALMLVLAMPAWSDISRDAAVVMAQTLSGGRVLSVEKIEREGRLIWRLKVLTPQGEVKMILIDAASGRAL